MSYRTLQEARVLITGASSGIGRELARQLADQRCRLILTGRRQDRLAELAAELADSKTTPLVVPGDLCDPATRRQLIDSANVQFGGLDILINNAGVGAIGPFASASEQRMRQVMEVNFFAAVELTRLAIPILQRGRQPLIVNVGSVLGHRAVPLKSEYCASKFALHGWTDALRAELASPPRIDVLLVSPSTTDTDFFDSVLEDSTGKNWKLATAQSPRTVAARTIQAMRRGKHEVILTFLGKSLVWLDRLCPPLANRIVTRLGKS